MWKHIVYYIVYNLATCVQLLLRQISRGVYKNRLSCLQVLGSVGKPVPLTEVKVVDIETGEMLARGVKGLIKARGPQIMKGYYKVRNGHYLGQPGWAKVFLKIDGCGLMFILCTSQKAI